MALTPALILAGGLGTRLRSVLSDKPKVLAPINGRPFLHYLLTKLERSGFAAVTLSTGYLASAIKLEFGSTFGALKLSYCQEAEPLGTGGAIRFASEFIEGPSICVINGDSYCDLDYYELLAHHRSHPPGAVSMTITQLPDTSRFGRVVYDNDRLLLGYNEKGLGGPGWINCGIYVIPRERILELPPQVSISIEREVFPRWCDEKSIFVYPENSGRFIDIGTPESLDDAGKFFTECEL